MANILITGANGFIGSWVARYCSALGHKVTCLVRKESNTSRLYGVNNLDIVKEDSNNWSKKMQSIDFDTLILSDWWGVANRFKNDSRQFENVTRWQQLTEAAVNLQAKSILAFGSQAELGLISGAIKEDLPHNPLTKYGEAKAEAFLRITDLTDNSLTRFSWLRVFSVYGPQDDPSWFIPSMILKLSQNEKFPMTKGEQNWSYLHAFDLARAVEKIVGESRISGTINIGDPKPITIAEVARIISNKLSKKNGPMLGEIPYAQGQVMSLIPIVEKLYSIGWEPMINIDDGIDQTIDWFLNPSKTLIYESSNPTVKFSILRAF